MATINLTKGNRAVGLLNEVAELISAETDALELARIQATLHSLMTAARAKAQAEEKATSRISKAAHVQTIKRKSASSRVATLCARC